MRVTFLEGFPDDPKLAVAWNSLAVGMERPEVFYTHQWALAASRAFAGTLRPSLFLVYELDRLCGVAALARPCDFPHNAFFLTASTADYCDILSAPRERDAVLAAIFGEMQRLDLRDLVLTNIPSDSATLRALPEIARSHGFHVHDRTAYDCGVVLFGEGLQRQTFLQSATYKEKKNRGLKKMSQMGSVQVTHLTHSSDETDLAPIFSAHVSRFLATQRVSPLLQRERREFLIELGRLLGPAGWLKLSRLEVNGQPLAWNYGFRYCDSWFWYLPTFKIEHEHLSPGSCLLRLLIREGCLDPLITRFDLGLGDEGYKRRFANSSFTTRYLRLTSSSVRHSAVFGRQWLASSVNRFPELDNRLRKTQDRLRALRNRKEDAGMAATVRYAFGRVVHQLKAGGEVLLFESIPIALTDPKDAVLIPLDWQNLAEAAIRHANDPRTLQYLMRCAKRLRRGGSRGYLMKRGDRSFAHFLWICDFDGFQVEEIDYRLASADPTAAMIFDCWTPVEHRGNGFYPMAIRIAAACLQEKQRSVWIFSAATNKASCRGILKAQFVHRYSLLRQRKGTRSTVIRREARSLTGTD